MDEFSTLIAIITLIVSILQIVLFFKIWKMTNDTAEIKQTLKNILIRELSVETRKDRLIEDVIKKLDFYDGFTYSKSNLEEAIDKQTELQKPFIIGLLDVYNLSDIYTIEELKEDVRKNIEAKYL